VKRTLSLIVAKHSLFYQICIYSVFLFIYFYLRLRGIQRPFWQDELISLSTLNANILNNPFYFGVSTNLPFFYYILKIYSYFLNTFNISMQYYRILPLIFNLATLVYLSYHTKKRWGLSVSIICSLFFCLSPIQVYYSLELRAYSLIQLLLCIQAFKFLDILNNKNNYSSFLLVSILSILTHYCAYIMIAGEFLLLIILKVLKKDIKLKLFLNFSLLLFISLGIFLTMGQSQQFSKSINFLSGYNRNITIPDMISFSSLVRIKEVITFYYFFGLYYFQADPWIQFSVKKISLLLIFIGLLFIYKNRDKHTLRDISMLFSLLIINLTISLFGEYLGLYFFGGRHIMPFSFLIYIYLSWVLSVLYRKSKLTTLLIVYIFYTLILFSYCSTTGVPETEQGNLITQCINRL